MDELPVRLNEVPKDRPVVIYQNGIRSARGRDILLKASFTSAAGMTGGLTRRQAQRMPLVSGQ